MGTGSINNQHIGPCVLPDSLKSIAFGWRFNRLIGPGVLPDSLKHIVFGNNFDKQIGQNVLPDSLKSIVFGNSFNQPIEPNVLPNSLKTICFGCKFNHSMSTLYQLDHVEYIMIKNCNLPDVSIEYLPTSLKYLAVHSTDALLSLNDYSGCMHFDIIFPTPMNSNHATKNMILSMRK